jgi:NitT/TauT family transport system permease protein
MSLAGRIRAWQVGLLIAALGLWEIGAGTGFIDPFFLPRPSSILVRVAAWAGSADVYDDLAVTLTETILAFIIGTLLGVAAGLWLALAPFAAAVMDPFIKALNAIPRVILAPIFALWFGLGILSKVALGITLVSFIAFFNTYKGVREVNPVVVANAQILGASRINMLHHVYLLVAATWILSSLRASIGFAVVGAVVGEYLGSASGIGHRIAEADGLFDAVGVFAGMTVLSAFAGMTVLSAFVLLLGGCVSLLERRLVTWRPPAVNTGQG